jgi:phosphoribosylformimino-5-aminoimidazole carboxamide ribotide isomerase
MTRFRPCIDLHQGIVKQIVGSTLSDDNSHLQTNFSSPHPADYFARLYQRDGLTGGHVIQLGQGNEAAARSALAAWPGGLQLGGGITPDNAARWLDAGASHVIATSWLFDEKAIFNLDKLNALIKVIGRQRLVIDLSCRRYGNGWRVAMNRWQTLTNLDVNRETLLRMADYCAELLIHAADVEGQCRGIDAGLVDLLGKSAVLPITYAGGACAVSDLLDVENLSSGRVDLTIGSALDLFGGKDIRYDDCVAWNQRHDHTR